MNYKRENKTSMEFFWYALNIKNTNAEEVIQQIKDLQTRRIAKIVNLSEIFEKAKIKIRVIFIYAALTQKLKSAILEIPSIRHFIPRNSAPYVFSDIDDFLKYHFDKKTIPDIKNKYLHKHEINDPDSIIHSAPTKNKTDPNRAAMIAKYQIGDTVIIVDGIFKEHIGVIRDIRDDILDIDIQISNNKTNISTSMKFSDTELIKHNNK